MREWADKLAQDTISDAVKRFANLLEGAFAQDMSELESINRMWQNKCDDLCEKANNANKLIFEIGAMLGGDLKTEYVTGRRIGDTNTVYYEGKYETFEEAKRGIPQNNQNYFVAMRKVTPYVEVKK